MIRFQFSDTNQKNHSYYFTMKNVGDLKHIIFELEYQDSDNADLMNTRKTEFFMTESEWSNLKDIINAVV